MAKALRRAEERLASRRKLYDSMKAGPKKNGFTRPGSMNSHKGTATPKGRR